MAVLQRTEANYSTISLYMSMVYFWMSIGVLVTGLTAWIVGNEESLRTFFVGNTIMPIALAIAEIGLVFGMTSFIDRMSGKVAAGCFLLFSLLNGLTLSVIFIVYTKTSIASAFFTAAGAFLAMSVYGTVTKRDLTCLGSFLFMGLIGILIAGIVNIFLHSSMMHFLINCAGVLIFTLYTAFDTQRLCQFGSAMPLDDKTAQLRGSILGALTLYLDFINLFIHLLHLLGDSKD